MAFGLSVEHYSLPPRHLLYEEEEEYESEGKREGEERDGEKVDAIEGEVFSFIPNISQLPSQSAKLLIVCTSTVTASFVTSHVILKPHPLTSVVCRNPVKVLSGRYFRKGLNKEEEEERVGEIYEIEGRPNVMVTLLWTPLKNEYSNQWSRKMLNLTRPQKVIILHSLPLHQYFLTDEEREGEGERGDGVLLRSLQTRSWSDGPLAPLLSSSNMISGEPAAILSHCQVSSIPASMVSLYSSNDLTMKEQVTSLRPLFQICSYFHSALPLVSNDVANVKMESTLPKPRTDMNTLYT